eukprot:TRINITY_DN17785_c0_g1_i1.p5 TRINITY_DN17785_c0_g1~~TRINITY_DN17785_c0_g1_i1.p5  ORF type:complete len:104 (+),score=23.36 TRINITY_DN17785_c0_g1_i1:120-431(+)
MIRRPPRSTHCISSAASDVYKRQVSTQSTWVCMQSLSFKSEIYFFFKKNLQIKLELSFLNGLFLQYKSLNSNKIHEECEAMWCLLCKYRRIGRNRQLFSRILL